MASTDTSTTPEPKLTIAEVADQAIERAGSLEVALRRAEKAAANTRWQLKGKGAEAKPPTAEQAKHLSRRLADQDRLVKQLRSRRDKAAKTGEVADVDALLLGDEH